MIMIMTMKSMTLIKRNTTSEIEKMIQRRMMKRTITMTMTRPTRGKEMMKGKMMKKNKTREREGGPGGRAGPSSSHISSWPSGSC